MKDNRREVGGRIFSHNEGLGTVTRQMMEDRAREIAMIAGRSRPTKEDRILARQELLRMRGVREAIDELDEDHESLDPSETPAGHGRQIPNFESDDEEQVQLDLVEQGVDEADHELMLEGHCAQEEDDEDEEEEEKEPERFRNGKGGDES
jgi:hypothetical protein